MILLFCAQANAEPESAIALVPQLKRESPQHSAAFTVDAAENGLSGAYGDQLCHTF